MKLLAVNAKNIEKSIGDKCMGIPTKSPMSWLFPLKPINLHCTESSLSPYVPPGWSLSLIDKIAGREREEYDKKHMEQVGIHTKSPMSWLFPLKPRLYQRNPHSTQSISTESSGLVLEW